MRIPVLVSLGLPLLAATGAMAYGSLWQISTTLATSRSVAVAPPVHAALSASPALPVYEEFVQASLSTWALPETPDARATPVVPVALRDGSGPAPERGPVAAPDAMAAAMEVAAATEVRPRLRPQKRAEPKIVVSGGKTGRLTRNTVKEAAKPVFKMPWQTGIYQ